MRKSAAGFTLIELLVAVSIAVIIPTMGFVALARYRADYSLKLAAQTIAAMARGVRDKSVTQEEGRAWGLYFSSSATGTDSVIAYEGPNFATGTPAQVFSLKSNISFSEPAAGFSFDLPFAAMDGSTGAQKVLTAYPKGYPGTLLDIIIDRLGRVTTRIETDVIGYWHFDESSASLANDATGAGNGAALSSSPSPTWESGDECAAGACLSFHGNSSVSVPPSPSFLFDSDFTVMFWENVSASEPQRALSLGSWDTGENLDIAFNDNRIPSGVLAFWNGERVAGRTVSGGNDGDFTDGVWHHIALTRAGSEIALYADGALVGSASYEGAIGSATEALIFGRSTENPGQHWKGSLDEPRIYGKAFTAEEIRLRYEDLNL